MYFYFIDSYPFITQYTIQCSNDITVAYMILGDCGEHDDQNEPGLCKVINDIDTFVLNKKELCEIFISNKTPDPNYDVINSLIISLQLGGYNPIVKTSYKINPMVVKNIKKEH